MNSEFFMGNHLGNASMKEIVDKSDNKTNNSLVHVIFYHKYSIYDK